MKKILTFAFVFAIVGLVVGDHYLLQSLKTGTTVVVKNEVVAPEKRVINLPEDGTAFYTTLFLPANWQADNQCRRLVANFAGDTRLQSLKAQTHYNQYAASDAMFAARYATSVTELPCVTVTDAKGAVYYKASGQRIPKLAKELATDIQRQIVTKRCPNGKCPWDDGEEQQEKIPDTQPPHDDGKVPDVAPEPERGLPLWLAVILGFVGVGFGVGGEVMKKWKSLG